MKRIALIIIGILLCASNVFGAWTYDTYIEGPVTYRDGSLRYVLKVVATSDGTDPAEFNFSDELANQDAALLDNLRGAFFYEVQTTLGAAGAAPDAAWDVSFDDEHGADLLTLTGLSETQSSKKKANTTLSQYPNIGVSLATRPDIQIDFGDIGSAGDTVTLYLIFLK